MKEYKTPMFNAGISYVQDLIHRPRLEGNIAIKMKNYELLHDICTGFHVNLMSYLDDDDQKKKDLEKVRNNCVKMKNMAKVKGHDAVYSEEVVKWFTKLSRLAHELKLVMPYTDTGLHGVGDV